MNSSWLRYVSPLPRHAGVASFRNGVINPWRRIGDYELFIFTGDTAQMIIEDVEYVDECPWFIIVPPGTPHISYCLGERTEVHYCHFDWTYRENRPRPFTEYVEGNVGRLQTFSPPSFLPSERLVGRLRSSYALELHQRVARLVQGDERERLVSRGPFLEELLELLAPPLEGTVDRGYVLAERIRERLTALAHEGFSEATPVKGALGELGMSYHYLERLFKRRFGVSPNRYVSLIRIEQAKRLLRESGGDVSGCAAAMGYGDCGYFIRFFRKHVGVTPGVYGSAGSDHA